MTIFDLEHLVLTYSPLFGTVKDPVNMVGFVSSNVVRGHVDIIHPDELELKIEQAQVVDVWLGEEF